MTESIVGTAEAIRATVRSYLAALASGCSAAVVELYTDDATLEDPAGSEPRLGRDAIAQFYRAIDGTPQQTELLSLHVSGQSSAFHFRVTTRVGDAEYEIEPIDVMTFDGDARITGMWAYWSPVDMRRTR